MKDFLNSFGEKLPLFLAVCGGVLAFVALKIGLILALRFIIVEIRNF